MKLVLKFMLWSICFEQSALQHLLWQSCFEQSAASMILWESVPRNHLRIIGSEKVTPAHQLRQICYEKSSRQFRIFFVLKHLLWTICSATSALTKLLWQICCQQDIMRHLFREISSNHRLWEGDSCASASTNMLRDIFPAVSVWTKKVSQTVWADESAPETFFSGDNISDQSGNATCSAISALKHLLWTIRSATSALTKLLSNIDCQHDVMKSILKPELDFPFLE